jgi:hypothetical protein
MDPQHSDSITLALQLGFWESATAWGFGDPPKYALKIQSSPTLPIIYVPWMGQPSWWSCEIQKGDIIERKDREASPHHDIPKDGQSKDSSLATSTLLLQKGSPRERAQERGKQNARPHACQEAGWLGMWEPPCGAMLVSDKGFYLGFCHLSRTWGWSPSGNFRLEDPGENKVSDLGQVATKSKGH